VDARSAGPLRAGRLATALDGAALIEYVQLDDAFHAVTVVNGRTRWHALCERQRVRDLLDRLPFALHRLVRHQVDAAGVAAALTMLRDTARRFDAFLMHPLRDETRDRPLVIVPTGHLQSLPWSILPSCKGRPVTVSPSASLWLLASADPQPGPYSVAVAAGPGLPAAVSEAHAVAAIHQTAPLVGGDATVSAVRAALSQAGLVHIAAHGRLQTQNPLFSWLQLADGPFTAYDIESLSRVPRMVVLAACDSARSVVCAGDELLGISASFLAQGTQQVIAPVLSIPDAETEPLMVAFHRLLAAGHSAPEALAHAQSHIGDDPAVIAAAAGFVCIGGRFTLTPSGPAEAASAGGDGCR